MKRVALGLVIAPIGALATLLVTLTMISPNVRSPFRAAEFMIGVVRLAIVVWPLAYLTELAVGLPIINALRRRRAGLGMYTLAGGATGAAPFVLLALFYLVVSFRNGGPGLDEMFPLSWAVLGFAAGLPSGALFWWVGIQSRPGAYAGERVGQARSAQP
jgi:hypothetical protein